MFGTAWSVVPDARLRGCLGHPRLAA
jgi:hypothetical protein